MPFLPYSDQILTIPLGSVWNVWGSVKYSEDKVKMRLKPWVCFFLYFFFYSTNDYLQVV